MAKGFRELVIQNGCLDEKQVDYQLITREDKVYAEPIDKPQNNVGIANGEMTLNTWWPLEDKPCKVCGVYGLVESMVVGQYVCANCGGSVILYPETNLDIR